MFHHKVLTFLKEKYEKHQKEEIYKYCFTKEQLSKELDININKIESILFDLKEFGSVDFSISSGFKISETGIKNQLTRFFIYKGNENFKSNIKDIVQILIPILSLIIAISAIFFKVENINKENEKKLKNLIKRVDKLEEQKVKDQTLQTPNTLSTSKTSPDFKLAK